MDVKIARKKSQRAKANDETNFNPVNPRALSMIAIVAQIMTILFELVASSIAE